MKQFFKMIGVLVFLGGCSSLNPMELLPENERFLLNMHGDLRASHGDHSISVQELLTNARMEENTPEDVIQIQISYDHHLLDKSNYEFFHRLKNQKAEILCGPYEYGDPLSAAAMAIRICREIQLQLNDQDIFIEMRFEPNAAKGFATINPLMNLGGPDA